MKQVVLCCIFAVAFLCAIAAIATAFLSVETPAIACSVISLVFAVGGLIFLLKDWRK